MAHNRSYKPEDILFPDQIITESRLVEEMEKSYIEYAMSVIVGRALPDVRDGLKPVHRRILYTMYESGLTSDKPFKKSATCVGDVLGKYHPHGDASVYDAMVRLAQNFSMRYVLVDGHGNFGSVDGDPAAAYRYTEARMSRISDELLRDIDKETVDWDPNFDESREEPRVLPSRFPNLLVNGSSGIAVGMATNIPPHNLTEVINACICVLDNPEAELSDLMEHVKGPDFPTKGIILGRSGIRAAYATGRGKVVVRARTEFEEFGNGRTRIIVTELPYQVNKRQLIKSIADQVKDKRLEGISDLRDETDRNGMRMVIELKKDANPQVVLNTLFKQTALQSNFSIIMLALVDNQKQPKILSLRQILDEYLDFQKEVIVRRTRYDLRKAQERAHLLEGLLIAQDNIDEVIKIIRSSYDDAKQNLMNRFGLDDVQAQAICDMRLIALQGLNREKLENEYKELQEKIEYYNRVLSDDGMVRDILKEELTAIRDKYGDKRVTEIQDVEDEIDIEDLIEEEQCVFTLTQAGYIKRTPVSEYTAQSKGGMGKKGMTTRDEDCVVDVFTASSHDYLFFFTDTGKVYRKKGYQIPESGKSDKGTNMVNVLPVESGEKAFLLEEQLTPPADRKMDKILYYNLQPEVVEKKVMADKAVFRGVCVLHVVYLGEDGRLCVWDTDVPFSQYADLDSAYDENPVVAVVPCVTSLDLEVDENGFVQLKAGLLGQYLLTEQRVVTLCEDAYSPIRQMELTRQQLWFPAVLEQDQQTFRAEQPVQTDAKEVVDVTFWPEFWEEERTEDGIKLTMPGQFQALCYDSEGNLSSLLTSWKEERHVSMGENAILVSEQLDLTLTGRNVGLPERVPMVGFPFHVRDKYIDNIRKENAVVVIEPEEELEYLISFKELFAGEVKSDEELEEEQEEHEE